MGIKYATIEEGLEAVGVDRAKNHLFLCLGPDCCSLEEGTRTWEFLKRRCADLKLPLLRTKAGCFRVCVGGPWLVVYPEGLWYSRVTPERCEEIVQRHLIAGKPIWEWVEKAHPLTPNLEP